MKVKKIGIGFYIMKFKKVEDTSISNLKVFSSMLKPCTFKKRHIDNVSAK